MSAPTVFALAFAAKLERWLEALPPPQADLPAYHAAVDRLERSIRDDLGPTLVSLRTGAQGATLRAFGVTASAAEGVPAAARAWTRKLRRQAGEVTHA